MPSWGRFQHMPPDMNIFVKTGLSFKTRSHFRFRRQFIVNYFVNFRRFASLSVYIYEERQLWIRLASGSWNICMYSVCWQVWRSKCAFLPNGGPSLTPFKFWPIKGLVIWTRVPVWRATSARHYQ